MNIVKTIIWSVMIFTIGWFTRYIPFMDIPSKTESEVHKKLEYLNMERNRLDHNQKVLIEELLKSKPDKLTSAWTEWKN